MRIQLRFLQTVMFEPSFNTVIPRQANIKNIFFDSFKTFNMFLLISQRYVKIYAFFNYPTFL